MATKRPSIIERARRKGWMSVGGHFINGREYHFFAPTLCMDDWPSNKKVAELFRAADDVWKEVGEPDFMRRRGIVVIGDEPSKPGEKYYDRERLYGADWRDAVAASRNHRGPCALRWDRYVRAIVV